MEPDMESVDPMKFVTCTIALILGQTAVSAAEYTVKDSPEQIAISTISEILAIRSGRKPTSLRERRQPIHVDVGD